MWGVRGSPGGVVHPTVSVPGGPYPVPASTWRAGRVLLALPPKAGVARMTYTEEDMRGRRSPDGRRGPGNVYGERPALPSGKKGKKSQKSRRPPDPWQAKTAVIVGAVLMVLSGFVVVGGKIFTSLA